MGCWEGGLAECWRIKPATNEAGGGAGKKVHRGGNQIAGERISDPGQGFGFRINFLHRGQEKKTAPAILRVLPGQPDGVSAPNDKNSFGHAGRLGPGFLRRGKSFFGWADRMKGTLRAERIFWKTDESSQFHERLIVGAWIFLWNHGTGDTP